MDIIQTFKKEYRSRFTKKTLYLYELGIQELLTVSGKTFDTVTKKDIRNWLHDLNKKGLQPATVVTRLSGVKNFYQYCLEEGLLNHDPSESIPFPNVNEQVPRYLELEQLNALREHVKENLVDRAIVEMLYTTGLRISELVALKKEDMDWSERVITIYNGKGKKERIVLFTYLAAECLQAYLNKRTDDLPYLFVNKQGTIPINIRTLQFRFQKYRDQLGFYFSIHTLRHTFAAHLAQKGMPLECIQQLLGHKNPHQTRIYARLYNHARKEMYDQYM